MTFSIADIPIFTKQTIALVTGATSGIGKIAARELYRHGAKVYIIARNPQKASALVSELTAGKNEHSGSIEIVIGDFMDLKSIVSAAKAIADKETKLDILLNNAGIMFSPYEETSDGYESTLQVNYIAPYLLTRLLLPLCQAAEAPRIVNVSSIGHRAATGFNFSDPNFSKGLDILNRGKRYFQSKLANILFTKELAKLYPDILSVSVHPGVITKTALYDSMGKSNELFGLIRLSAWFTSIGGSIVGTSLEDGALTSIFCAVDKSLTLEKDNGAYFVPVAKKSTSTAVSNDPILAEKLWTWTEEQLAEKGYLVLN